MLDNKEAVEGAKRQARNRKEVECSDYLAVVVEKRPASTSLCPHPDNRLGSEDNAKPWARKSRTRARAVRRECEAHPMWDSPPSCVELTAGSAHAPLVAPVGVAETASATTAGIRHDARKPRSPA